MRIAFLGPSYPWRGGIAQFAENLAEKLSHSNNEIMMFTFIHQYPALLFPGSKQIDDNNKSFKLATQRILTPYNPLTWFSAIHDIRGWNPDVIIVSYWLPVFAPAFGFILRFLKKVKRVCLVHNVEFHEKWLLANKLTKYAFSAIDYFITLSDVSTQSIAKLHQKAPVLKLFHPVYEKVLINHSIDHNRSYKILFFGFVKHYKGLDILLEALPGVISKIPQLKLVIAGDVYGNKSVYLDIIDRLGLINNIELHFEYIPDVLLEKLFADSDLCVIPYRSATQSGVVQMSFAYKVPVIATRVGGLEEIVEDGVNGFLVEPENPMALAEKIIEFYDFDYYIKFKSAIENHNNQYSWQKFTDLISNILI